MIKNYSSNAFFEKFDVYNQYGYLSHHYLRVIKDGETRFNFKELKARESMLNLGFSPAIIIYKSFAEFLRNTRDF